MKTNYLIYYILKLITKGQEWQYKNLNGQGEKPKSYFTSLQWLAILFSIIFLYVKPLGLKHEIIDYILSSLSIMMALFLSLIVVIFDKFNNYNFKESQNDSEKIRKFHMWNFFYQFNAITSYAILISSLVVILLIFTLLFGKEEDLSQYVFISFNQLNINSILLFCKLSFTYLVRFCIIYFLLDFFILCIYAVSSIFQYISNDFEKQHPKLKINREEPIEKTLRKEYGRFPVILKLIVFIILMLFLVYVFL